eukprot:356258-Chlamydomonas_euryale.AAC.4
MCYPPRPSTRGPRPVERPPPREDVDGAPSGPSMLQGPSSAQWPRPLPGPPSSLRRPLLQSTEHLVRTWIHALSVPLPLSTRPPGPPSPLSSVFRLAVDHIRAQSSPSIGAAPIRVETNAPGLKRPRPRLRCGRVRERGQESQPITSLTERTARRSCNARRATGTQHGPAIACAAAGACRGTAEAVQLTAHEAARRSLLPRTRMSRTRVGAVASGIPTATGQLAGLLALCRFRTHRRPHAPGRHASAAHASPSATAAGTSGSHVRHGCAQSGAAAGAATAPTASRPPRLSRLLSHFQQRPWRSALDGDSRASKSRVASAAVAAASASAAAPSS